VLKRDEMFVLDSCLNKAREDEMLFVLLARDPAFPATVRFWAAERVRLGKDGPASPKVLSALACAAAAEREHAAAAAADVPPGRHRTQAQQVLDLTDPPEAVGQTKPPGPGGTPPGAIIDDADTDTPIVVGG